MSPPNTRLERTMMGGARAPRARYAMLRSRRVARACVRPFNLIVRPRMDCRALQGHRDPLQFHVRR